MEATEEDVRRHYNKSSEQDGSTASGQRHIGVLGQRSHIHRKMEGAVF